MMVSGCSDVLDSSANTSTIRRSQLWKHFCPILHPHASRHILVISIKRHFISVLIRDSCELPVHKTILRGRHFAISLVHQVAEIVVWACYLTRTTG